MKQRIIIHWQERLLKQVLWLSGDQDPSFNKFLSGIADVNRHSCLERTNSKMLMEVFFYISCQCSVSTHFSPSPCLWNKHSPALRFIFHLPIFLQSILPKAGQFLRVLLRCSAAIPEEKEVKGTACTAGSGKQRYRVLYCCQFQQNSQKNHVSPAPALLPRNVCPMDNHCWFNAREGSFKEENCCSIHCTHQILLLLSRGTGRSITKREIDSASPYGSYSDKFLF